MSLRITHGVGRCDDESCCRPATRPNCGRPEDWTVCPQALYNSTTVIGAPHPVFTCNDCQTHQQADKKVPIHRWAMSKDNNDPTIFHQNNTGHRAQLCRRCIHAEVVLYWERIQDADNPNNGTPPATATSRLINHVSKWPHRNPRTNQGKEQNLCICESAFVNLHSRQCHGCRDGAYRFWCEGERAANGEVLRTRSKAYITGDDRLFGIRTRKVGSNVIHLRDSRGIARACPCGELCEPARVPRREYASICLACMGVRIRGRNLPPRLQEPAINAWRQSRSHGMQTRLGGEPRTKVHRARRSALYRVNIERPWVEDDIWIGGAEEEEEED